VKQAPDGVPFASQSEWEDWLATNHATSEGVWIKFAKKGSEIESVDHAQALESALCYGWIDGQARAVDDRFFLQRFTPRRARSTWSRVNTEKAEGLERGGRMKPAGLAEMERARADGRWDAAYEPPSSIAVPDDLQRELNANPTAREFFATLESRNRYAILYRLQDAKTAETRARRLEKFVSMLKAREKIYP
jgi:uncharacterized protein YdeI (YjbR/CyaY-like superfamily)